MNGVERSNDGVKMRKCPFCGGEAEEQWKHGWWSIICSECYAEVGSDRFKTIEDAIKAWNNRTPLERVIERLETEGKLADEERDRYARANPLHFDTAKGYATGIYNAIEIIKQEMM